MTRAMGPIERELRGITGMPEDMWYQCIRYVVSLQAYSLVRGCCSRFAGSGASVSAAVSVRALPDVLSEAIECAEALGI